MNWVTCAIAVALFFSLVNRRHLLQHTSMQSAWRWAMAAACILLFAVTLRVLHAGSLQLQSLLQYSAAVFALTPFIDVLGARRPAHAAWPWFVIAPMILVLHWPAISQLAAENAASAIEIPTPTFVGFLLVVLMGCGNYFGSGNMPSAFLAAPGIIFIALPVSEWSNFSNPWMLPTGAFLMLAAVTLAIGGRREKITDTDDLPAHDALWTDFCSLYGMVWGKRVMDRVNQFAERESWSVRMSVFGFVRHPEGTGDQNATAVKQIDDRPLQILTWVLRRFLDREFLLRYLPESAISNDTL